jgi:hypothetical protein
MNTSQVWENRSFLVNFFIFRIKHLRKEALILISVQGGSWKSLNVLDVLAGAEQQALCYLHTASRQTTWRSSNFQHLPL